MSSFSMIVGLGNPGPEYEQHRHNVGAWCVESLASSLHATLRTEPKLQARLATVNIEGHEYRLLVPLTYMNESGLSVSKAARFFKIPAESIIVIHDELDLQTGTVRFKKGGGHGGHNGLRSIMSHLNSPEFSRIRIGIDHPGQKHQVSNYVLSRPNNQDQRLLNSVIEEVLYRLNGLLLDSTRSNSVEMLHLFNAANS